LALHGARDMNSSRRREGPAWRNDETHRRDQTRDGRKTSKKFPSRPPLAEQRAKKYSKYRGQVRGDSVNRIRPEKKRDPSTSGGRGQIQGHEQGRRVRMAGTPKPARRADAGIRGCAVSPMVGKKKSPQGGPKCALRNLPPFFLTSTIWLLPPRGCRLAGFLKKPSGAGRGPKGPPFRKSEGTTATCVPRGSLPLLRGNGGGTI